MNHNIPSDVREIMDAVHYRPSVSIILPFDVKVNAHKELSHSLKVAADKVEQELNNNYPAEMSELLMNKLRQLIRDVKIDTKGKSMALFVSPIFQKVYYLEVPVEEKIVVDDSFEIRDLVFNLKQKNHFLLMRLSSHICSLYLWNQGRFNKVITDQPMEVEAYLNEAPERVANFSDMGDRKEIITQKFIQQMDQVLGRVLKENPLPVIVIGPDKVLGHFRQVSKNISQACAFITGNYDESSYPELNQLIAPHVNQWRKDRQDALINDLEDAANKRKLSVGMQEVWREVMNHNGRLMLVERDFMYPAQRGGDQTVINPLDNLSDDSLYIRDAVDDAIEKLLSNGGDVEFVEPDALKDYGRIALIQFYS